MNGFVVVDARTGTSIYSMVLQANLGVRGISEALDDASAASTLAAMAFGVLLNAASLSPQVMRRDEADEGLLERCQAFSRATPSPLEDTTPNAAALRGVDTASGCLCFFAHSVFPVFCVASSLPRCPLVMAICERVCKAFCAHCGRDYVAKAQLGLKGYKKTMSPIVKGIYGLVIRNHLQTMTAADDTNGVDGMTTLRPAQKSSSSDATLAIFLLLSEDRKKIVRSVALRPPPATGTAHYNLFSDPESEQDVGGAMRADEPLGPCRPAISPAKLTRRELALVRPLVSVKPSGPPLRWWVSQGPDGRTTVVCRDDATRAFVTLVARSGEANREGSAVLQGLVAAAERISSQLWQVEAYLMCLQVHGIALPL